MMRYDTVMEEREMSRDTERIMLEIVDYVNSASDREALTRIVELQEMLEALRLHRVQWIREMYR